METFNRWWDAADEDHNGVISLNEFRIAFPWDGETMYRKADKNGDGSLDREEVLEMLMTQDRLNFRALFQNLKAVKADDSLVVVVPYKCPSLSERQKLYIEAKKRWRNKKNKVKHPFEMFKSDAVPSLNAKVWRRDLLAPLPRHCGLQRVACARCCRTAGAGASLCE